MMTRTFTPNVGSLMVTLLFLLSGALYAQNYTPAAGVDTTLFYPSDGMVSISDPGGPGGSSTVCGAITTTTDNYLNCNCNTIIAVCPDVTGQPVELNFSQFGILTPDYFIVYDGPDTSAPILYNNNVNGIQSNDRCYGPQIVRATNPDGCLTVMLFANASGNEIGFLASISTPGLVDAGIVAIRPDGAAVAGSNDVEVQIRNYGTQTINTATVEWSLGGTPQTPFSFVGSIAPGQTSSFVTIGSAVVAGGESLRAWTSNPNGTADTQNSNDTLSRQLCVGMAGTYTINHNIVTGGSNFSSFSDAVAALASCGVGGPVVFDITAGLYTEQVTIPAIAGASPTNIVTFRSATLDSTDVRLQWATTTAAANNFLLSLNGAKYVSFERITFERTGALTTYQTIVTLSNGALGNSFSNCQFLAPITTNTATTTNRTSILANTGELHNGTTVRNSLFAGNSNGIWVDGIAGVSGDFVVENNHFYTAYVGVFFLGNRNVTIHNNIIERQVTSATVAYFGVSLRWVYGGSVLANKIATHTGGENGIRLREVIGTPASPFLVANNFVQTGGTASGTARAISLEDGNSYIDVAFNSTNVTGGNATSGRAFSFDGATNTAIRVLNNNFVNSVAGYSYYVDGADAVSALTVSNHNNFYTAGNVLAYWNGSPVNNLPLLQLASGKDQNSFSVNPQYTSYKDLYTNVGLLNGAALPFAGITTDVDGEPRDANNPDIGAAEFAGLGVDAGIVSIVSPSYPSPPGTYDLDVRIGNFGTTTLTSATIQWELNGVPQTDVPYTGSLATGEYDTVTLLNFTPSSGDQIKAWTSMPNGLADADNSNDTLNTSLCISLVGTFTINSALPSGAGNYASFSEAAAALGNCGISGPVVFNVVPGNGPFTEQVTIPTILGTSTTNTVTFNCFGDTLQFDPPTGSKFVLQLDGAQHVIIDSLYIRSISSTFGYGILFSNNASYNTIRKSHIDLTSTGMSTTSANTTAILFSGSISSNTVSGNNGSFNLIEDNTLRYGTFGIRINGGGSQGNRLVGNVIQDNYSHGIYILEGNNNTLVEGNDISRPNRTNSTTYYGVALTGLSENCLIKGNSLHHTHEMVTSGIVYGYHTSSTVDATVGNENIWANNLFYRINNNAVTYAFANDGGDGAHYLHNTVVNDNQNATASSAAKGVNIPSETHNIKVIGNIFYVTRSGPNGFKSALTYGNLASTIESNYNVFFVSTTGATTNLGQFGPSNLYLTLADWQQTGYDLNSYEVDPFFVDTVNFDFTPQNPIFNNIVPNQGILEDIFGTARGTHTDPGAIEFFGVPNDVGVLSYASPTSLAVLPGTQNVEVDIRNFGTTTVNTFDLDWSVNGLVQGTTINYATPLAPSTTTPVISLGTYNATGTDTLRAWTSNPNGGIDGFPLNDTLTMITCLGLSGNYTIDAGQATGGINFVSFQAAIDSLLSCGVAGPVVFDVVQGSGPYQEQVVIPAINGASAINTITFRGHGDTLQFDPPSAARYIVKVEGAKHIILDSLFIRSLSGLYGIGVMLSNGSDSIIVRNCTVDLSLTTSTASANSAGISITGSNSSTAGTAPVTASNSLVENNLLMGGAHGITVYSSADGTGAVNNHFIGNTIVDFNTDGIKTGNNRGSVFRNNDISRGGRVAVGVFTGIRIEGGARNTIFDGNTIHNSHGSASTLTGASYPVIVTGNDVGVGEEVLIINNLIYNMNGSGLIYAIYNLGSDGMHAYNNTVVLNDVTSTTTAVTRGIWQSGVATNVEFKNNIVYITRGGTGDKWGIHLNAPTSDVTLDYNVYYVNGASGNNFVGHYDGNNYTTLADWQTANGGIYDQNGFYRDPRFVDAANHDYTPTSAVINDQAEPLAVVTTDLYGTPRSATPDPGAIEYVPLADDASPIALLSPAAPFAPGNYPIDVVIQNLGIADLTEVEIWVNINDGIVDTTFQVFNHSPILLLSTEMDTVTLGSFDFTSESYTVTVWTANPNGGPDANTTNDTLVVNLCLALPAGNYTINSALPTGSGNYQSFNDAAAALACGILGDVVFTVATGSGPYNEQVSIGEVVGSGPSATITFDGQGETLTHNGSIKYATLSLLGTDYVTIQNLTVENTSNVQGFGIHLTQQADHNTIKNSTILMSTTTTNTINYGITASASETSGTAEGNNANYLWIDSVTVIGGYRGIGMEGSSGALLKSNRITNSTIMHQHNAGVWIDHADSLILFGNYVDSLRDQTNADGFYLTNVRGYFEVESNIVFAPDWGIYMINANATNSPQRSRLVNNMVRSDTDFGVYFVTASHVDVFHNTLVGSPAMALATNTTRMDIRNNIFYSDNGNAFEDRVAVGTSNHVDIDNNIYYSGSASLLIRYGGTTTAFDYATLSAWQVAVPAFNQNSLQGDPVFVSNTDLHVLGTLANDVGDNSVGVTVDIDGDVRPLAPGTTVDIGADEYTPFTANLAVTNIIEPLTNQCGDSSMAVVVVIYNFGTQPQGNFDVEVEVTGAITQSLSTTYVGPIAPGTFDTVVVGNINTYAGGVFNLFAEHMLATDQFPSNDTLSTTVEIVGIPAPPTAVGDTGCIGDVLELTANLGSFIELEWFDDAALTNSVGSGDIFFTPVLSSSETYYVTGVTGAKERTGKPAATTTGTFISATAGWGLEFEVTQPVTIDSVTIYPVGTGTISIGYYDLNAGNALVAASTPAAVSGSGATTPVRVYLGWTVAPGRYNMGIVSYSGITNLIRDSGGNNFPYTAPTTGVTVVAGKSSFTSSTTASYYWFYDWVIKIPGCNSPAQEVTAFISAPVSDAGPDDTICAGETATLTAQNGDQWNWTGGLTTQTINVSPANSTTYTLTIVDEFGCTGTPDQATVVVNQLPPVNAGVDTAICAGGTATLGVIGASTYEWSTSETTTTITTGTAGIYSVTGTGANGCINTDEVEVTVNALPTGNAGADEEICVGQSVQLFATGGVSYVWSTNETTSDITVSPTNTTPYTLTTTDQFGCVGEDTVTVVVNQLPVIDITVRDTICIGETNVTLTATPAGGTFSGAGVTSGVFNAESVGVGTYTITYNYTDANGCSASATKQINVDASLGCTPGIGSIAGLGGIGVYPNPFNDKVSIEFTATSNEPVRVSMFNLLGQEVFSAEVEVVYGVNTFTIDTDRSLAEGFYVIELRKGNDTYMEKLLRVR